MDARPLVDAVTGVEAHPFGRNVAQADIDRLHINFGAAFFLRVVEAGLIKNIRQKRIVDLQQDAGVDDCPVFLAHFHSQRVEILLVRFVILVLADAAAAFTFSMSAATSFSPRYLTGPTQTTGASVTTAPPSIARLKYCS